MSLGSVNLYNNKFSTEVAKTSLIGVVVTTEKDFIHEFYRLWNSDLVTDEL